MEIKKCMGCMEDYQGEPCPKCGFDNRQYRDPEYALPRETILAGKYLLGRLLGQGGFGLTYIGWDIGLERKVAIKEYFPMGQVSRQSGGTRLIWYTGESAVKARNDGMEAYLKEARKMARMDAINNVVRVLDIVTQNDTAYIVMDYVEGVTLKQRLAKEGPLSWEEAQKLFQSAIRTMESVHHAGIIHRDISPDNLMLTSDGEVILLDLGAAKDIQKNPGASSMQVAKNGFSPPEQYVQHGASGPWTDVYAMAATIYDALTGTMPPYAVDRMEADSISWDSPGLKKLPNSALAALRKALAVSISERTQSMEELEAGLFGNAEKETNKNRKGNNRKHHFTVWLTAGIAVVLILCAVGFWQKVVQPDRAYKQAQLLLDEGNYADAINAFHALGEYKDSSSKEKQAAESQEMDNAYNDALNLMENKKYIQAMWAFEKLHWKDSSAKAQEAKEAYWVSQQMTISAGYRHTVGVCEDGTAVATKLRGDANDFGQCHVEKWKNITAISTSYFTTVGLCSDGTVVAAGNNEYGQCDVTEWSDIVAISSGYGHTSGLRRDGTVVCAGSTPFDMSEAGKWKDIIAIAEAFTHIVALRSDGTVVAVGRNQYGQCDVEGWTDIVAIAVGDKNTAGLKADGTVVMAGDNTWHQCDVGNWSDITAIAILTDHIVGLCEDGTVVATGGNTWGQCDVDQWRDIVAISVGHGQTVGLHSDGTVTAVGYNENGQCDVAQWKRLRTPLEGT